jgi:hypothetical protein
LPRSTRGARYSPRWFDQAGLSPPSALYGRPDSLRSSSDHGTGGFVHPMVRVYRTPVRLLPARCVECYDVHQMGGPRAVRVALAALLLAASAACNSSDDPGPEPASPTVATEPAPTTTTNPYAVPAVIDAAYVNRVLAGLDAVIGDVTRLVLRTKTIPPEAYDRLKAVYSDPDFLQIAIDGYQLDIREGFRAYRLQPGNNVTTVTELLTARSDCIFAKVERDFSAVGVSSQDRPRIQWVGLRRLDAARDPNQLNPTSWSFSYDGFPPNRAQPGNPCRSI